MDLDFTRYPNGIPSRNPIAISGSLCFIELPNVNPHLYATGSIEDLSILALNRWRWRKTGEVVTTTLEDGLEKSITIGSVVLCKSRYERILHKNKNPLDARRENLKTTEKALPNVWEVGQKDAYLYLAKGLVVTVDAVDVPRLKLHNWFPVKTKGGEWVIRAMTGHDKEKPILLPRIILRIAADDRRPVLYRNGDRFDMRKDNLVIKGSVPSFSEKGCEQR